jgi:hypothetical protein
MVAGYTGLNFIQIRQLNYIEYLTYRRDAFIQRLNGTEEGQEYLRNAWRMEQTTPDRVALRRKVGGEEAQNRGQ